jgi:RND family efflux transporter MFP subunit
MRTLILVALAANLTRVAVAADMFTVTPVQEPDQKAVFATVESANVVPARARIGGTVAELAVRYGDRVERGQNLATVGDEKIVLQMRSLEAQIAGLEAQLAQAKADLDRAEGLADRGTIPRTRLDEVRTAFSVATNAYRSRVAERSVIQQQLTEGNVLAPASGRILKVPVTVGTVVLAGEPLALVAEQNLVLRLRVPERHAKFIKVGDPVRIDGTDLGRSGPEFGRITLIYPQIEDGRVVADATVSGLGDYFVGGRIRVWVSGGERPAFVIPSSFLTTRFGIDYVRLHTGQDRVIEVPVQRGRELPRPDRRHDVEILSGLQTGDQLVAP